MKTLQKTTNKTVGNDRTKLERDVVIQLARMVSENSADMSAVIAQYGLSLAHFNVLRILRGAKGDGLPCGSVGDKLISKEPDMTRLLDRMEKQELVVRSRDQVDRRVVTARITDHGLGILAKLDEPLDNLLHAQFGHVEKQKLEVLLEVLQELRQRPA
jgi:DNA-binding MarR family transcriptional regulator